MTSAVFIGGNKAVLQSFRRTAVFGEIFDSIVLEEQLSRVAGSLASGTVYNYIFIDEAFDRMELASFIEQAKNTAAGKKSCFVLVGGSADTDRQKLASGMITGFHGFLSKPFNLEDLEQVVKLAAKVRAVGSKHRLRAAAGLILADIIQSLEKEDRPSKTLWREIEDSCNWYKKLTGDSITLAVVDPLHKITGVERVKQSKGLSKLVKNLITSRLRALLPGSD